MSKQRVNGALKSIIFILLVLGIASLPSSLLFGSAAEWNGEPAAVASTPDQTAQAPVSQDGAKCDVVSMVYTTQKEFSVTVSGMSDKQTMEAILDEFDRYDMKALFFLTGIRVAEEPDIAKEILERGHSIGNETLNGEDLTAQDSYETIYNEIAKANDVIEKETGQKPRYLYNKGGNYNDDILVAAEACGLDLVTYSINLQSWKGKNAQDVKEYLREKTARGGVIALGTSELDETLKTIDLIAETAGEMGYSVVPLKELQKDAYQRKTLEEIEGYDAAQINQDYANAAYELMYSGSKSGNMVSLTFDDWGNDIAVNRILDILKQYGIKATFFLRGNGVENNPNLAKAISEAGHDVGNHTYSHPVITNLTPLEIEEEVVKCHKILTEAIQKQPLMVFRPPTGEINVDAAKAVGACGYNVISLYDLSPHDWDTANNKDAIVNYIKENVKSGSVIVLHLQEELDTYKALPEIIDYLKEKNFIIVPLSQMISTGDAVMQEKVRE